MKISKAKRPSEEVLARIQSLKEKKGGILKKCVFESGAAFWYNIKKRRGSGNSMGLSS